MSLEVPTTLFSCVPQESSKLNDVMMGFGSKLKCSYSLKGSRWRITTYDRTIFNIFVIEQNGKSYQMMALTYTTVLLCKVNMIDGNAGQKMQEYLSYHCLTVLNQYIHQNIEIC